jgi:PadR family transcriptional regulator PadR
MMVQQSTEQAEQILSELRRGIVILAVLSQLQEETYGYALREKLAGQGMEIPEGTLYPLLRRLESQELLQSRWQLEESRPRRYYQLSPQGQKTLSVLEGEWASIVAVMQTLLRANDGSD